MTGSYGKLVEKVLRKHQTTEYENLNPCKVAKILLADDDGLSNMALRSMIEQSGKYQVFSFYNGLDVSYFLIETNQNIRHQNFSKRKGKKCPQ